MGSPPPPPPVNADVASTAHINSGDSSMTVELHKQNSTMNTTVLKKNMMHKRKRKNIQKPNIDISSDPPQQSANSSSSSASTSNSLHSRAKGVRFFTNRRNPRVLNGSEKRNGSEADALALPLGMSIAAFVAQVLEKKDATGENMSVDHLSELEHCLENFSTLDYMVLICTLAVKESLSNVFGDKFNCFVNNFERSFQSTLMTLRVINESSQNRERSYLRREINSNYFHLNLNENTSTSNFQEKSTVLDLDEENNVHKDDSHNEINILDESRISPQLVYVPPNQLNSGVNHNRSSMITTFERSVNEQARSNDLKALEISLSMKKMKLKEAQIAVGCDLNVLERIKLSMGVSKAKFRAEKYKTELEDTRHAQLLKKCADCLVAGLIIMLGCLAYGTYIYSHQKLIEATESCLPIKESSSWWIPKRISIFNSGFQILWCQVQVISQMLFGILMIIAITYLLIQRSGSTNQTMPITFILLLLGVGCGFAGKFCIDTLGGSGTHWLIFWELLCLLHLFANICTSRLFVMLHGPVTAVDRSMSRNLFPYKLRRVVFYATLLMCLPLPCGLMPFAGIREWFDHFGSLVTSRMFE